MQSTNAQSGAAIASEAIQQIVQQRVFFVVLGVTLPTQYDGRVPPLILARSAGPGQADAVWFETVKLPEARGTNTQSCFCVQHELQMGTIDELVAHYRACLLASAERLVTSGVGDYTGVAQSQVAAVRLGYQPGQAACCKFLSHGHPLVVESFRSHVAATDQQAARDAAPAVCLT